VLLCIAHDPGVRLREIADQVGIADRAAHRIVGELVDAGYIVRERKGRQSRQTSSFLRLRSSPACNI
jgi:DNA-binding IclR family transcriptional regulator